MDLCLWIAELLKGHKLRLVLCHTIRSDAHKGGLVTISGRDDVPLVHLHAYGACVLCA